MMVGGLIIENCHLASVSFQLGDMLLRNGILLEQASDRRGGFRRISKVVTFGG